MANALALIPRATAAEPSSIMLLPAWLSEQLRSVSDFGSDRVTIENGQITKRCPTIPAALLPTPAQRSLISRRIAELQVMAIPGDPEDIAPVIGELLAAYAAQRIDANSTAAKTAGYLEALYDIPHWAICEALARWRRGEAGSDIREEEYSFAPSTVRLRRLALRIAAVPAGQAVRMRRLLDAEPERPLTTAQRKEYERRAAEMAAEIAAGSDQDRHRAPATTPAERAEQETRDREVRAHWQRWLLENGQKEAEAGTPATEQDQAVAAEPPTLDGREEDEAA